MNPELMAVARDGPQWHLLSAAMAGRSLCKPSIYVGWGSELWSFLMSILSTELGPQTPAAIRSYQGFVHLWLFSSFFPRQLEPEIASLFQESCLLKSREKGWPLLSWHSTPAEGGEGSLLSVK